MKLVFSTLLILSLQLLTAQEIKFENPDFKNAILRKYPEIDLNNDKKIDREEADKVETLSLMEMNLINANDVKYFYNLKYLSLTINKIKEFKLENFPKLEVLYIARNELKNLKITNLPSLK